MRRFTDFDLIMLYPGLTIAQARARARASSAEGRKRSAEIRAAEPLKPRKPVKEKGADCASRTSRRAASKIKAPAVNNVFNLALTPCCPDEKRSMQGGCVNCGDPCL